MEAFSTWGALFEAETKVRSVIVILERVLVGCRPEGIDKFFYARLVELIASLKISSFGIQDVSSICALRQYVQNELCATPVEVSKDG